MVTINVFAESIRFPYRSLKKSDIRIMLERACEEMGIAGAAVTVIAADNRFIQTINGTYRKKNRPTDVISFCEREGAFQEAGQGARQDGEFLGEIYLSLEKAEEQAEGYGVTLRQEVCRLAVHGLLHLLGYDHEGTERERIAMEAMEEKLLARLNGY